MVTLVQQIGHGSSKMADNTGRFYLTVHLMVGRRDPSTMVIMSFIMKKCVTNVKGASFREMVGHSC